MRTALPFLPQPVWQTAGSGGAAAKVAGTKGYVDLSLPQQLLQAKAAYDDQIYNRLMEYGAQLQVLGVLAGVFEATPDGVSGETLRAELAKVMAAYTTGLVERSKRTSWRQYDSLLDVASISSGLLHKGAGWAASQFGADDTAKSLSAAGDLLIETDPNALLYNMGKDWLEKTIASCKARWDEFWLDVQQKGALVAMARLKADADFLAGEIALDIAMGVVTGGAAVGIKLVAKRLAGEVTEIAIRVASKVAANVPDANLARKLEVPDRAIDPKILNEILDEDKLGTGSKSADVSARGEVPDPPKEKPDGDSEALSNGKVGDLAEDQARRDLAQKGYTDQRVIQNPQGNGVDIIARNPETGEVMFAEVKANGATMSGDQRDLGGPTYVRDRLQRVIAGDKEWSGATPQQVRDAKEAIKWLNANPAFKEIRYDVDRVTGAATNYRERSWDYEQGQRPRALPWRDAQGNEVTQAGKPKQPQARAPPK